MLKVAEAKEMVGLEGIAFEGYIVKLWEREAKQGEYGEYYEQNILVSDTNEVNTQALYVTLRDKPEVPKTAIGKKYGFDSIMSEKLGRKVGVKIVKQNYTKDGAAKTIIKAVVTKTANIKPVVVEREIDVDTGEDIKPKVMSEEVKPVSSSQLLPTENIYLRAVREVKNELLDPASLDLYAELTKAGYSEDVITRFLISKIIELHKK